MQERIPNIIITDGVNQDTLQDLYAFYDEWTNDKDQISVQTSGSTGAGSIATVASPMSTQSRNASIYGGKKAGNLLTGKKSKGKYANSVEARRQTKVNESMQDISYTLYVDGQPKRESADRNTIVGYIKHLKSKGITFSVTWKLSPKAASILLNILFVV